ncbi:hypothetical protein KL86DYS1_20287 [uncultured Dysgonomonas sp.]|uniref:Uncharacterized protein n=1 Tax=uncultured Dysgonomonas sp. TaxID=206096 RepID=A0A212JN12_9BACT|nr:hypothetical protein KL86DYS1_20287 [uncultured Dysgonomonas sp.]
MRNKYARPNRYREGKEEDFSPNPLGLDLAVSVKNTEIPLRLKSNTH